MDHELEADMTIDAFNRYAVDFVVIGAFAAIAQAVPIPPTMDIDFYASPEKINLERLADALEFLDAKIRVNDLDEGIAFDRSPEFLGKVRTLNLTCEFGEFDIARFSAMQCCGKPFGINALSQIVSRVREP